MKKESKRKCSMFFLKKNYPIILLVFVAMITHWRWIFIQEYFSSGDSAYFTWFNQTSRDLFAFPSIWSFSTVNVIGNGFGSLNVLLSWYPSLIMMYAGLANLFHSTIISSKLVFLIPIPIVSVVGSFLLIKHLLKNNLAGIVGAIVYSYNTTALILQTGTIQWAFAYACAPLVLYFYIKGVDKKRTYLSVLAGLLSFIAGSYDFRLMYIVFWVMVFYILFRVILAIKNKVYNQIISNMKYGLIPFPLIFLLNIFWILPFYTSNTISHNVLFDRALFGSQFFNLSEAITLFHPYWTGGLLTVFTVQPIPLYFWLIPLFAALGVVTNIKNKNVLFFTCIALLGILLAKQEDYPFPQLYSWLYYHFPGFNAYREASKFYILVALGYSVLIGAFGKFLSQIDIKNNLISCARYFVVVLIVAIFLWNAKPLISGSVGRLFIPITLPNDYKILANFLDNDHQFSRVLWFPAESKWSFFDNDHPIFSIYFNAYEWYLEFKKNPAYAVHTYNTTKIAPDLPWNLDILNQSFSGNFLNITNTKYIVIPPQYKDIPDDDMFLGTSINDRPFIINFFDRLSYLKRINIGSKDLLVYENSSSKPLIYITNSIESVYKVTDYQPVEYKYISPAEYTVEIRNISKPLYLNFNNTYAKDWGLDIGGGHYLPTKDHLQTDMQFNAFYINPKEVIENYSKKFYTTNADGSINLTVRIYYKLQDLVNIGAYISLATFLTVLAYLFFELFKVRYFIPKQIKDKRKKRA